MRRGTAAGFVASRWRAGGSGLPGGRGGGWLPALVSFAAALACALTLARVTHPQVVFPKYLAAAAAPPAEQAERLLDYSPLYLALVRLLLPWGYTTILGVQAVLHAATAAAAALAAARLAGRRWAWLGGLGVASYRPLLVYCGMLEPETVILACLAFAMLLGLLARDWLGGLPAADGEALPAHRFAPAGQPGAAAASPDVPVAAAASPAILDAPAASPVAAGAPEGGGLPAPAVRVVAPSRVPVAALAALAFACLAAAGLGRPQHLLLLPVWAWWMVAAAPPGDARRGARRVVWAVGLAVAAAALAAPLVARARVTGVPAIMNPGAVFYEGNGPGATGLTRFAPPAVIQLERSHRESVDYGHVAYRRIASAAAGRRLDPLAANRYWTGLAREAIAAHPAAAARRWGRKALLALAPYEGHDLLIAEALDRRLRRWLPWGFALPLLALPWLALSRRGRLGELAGPLAVAALACAVQVAVYASARQRLPAALALWIVLPALAADLAHGRTSAAVRPGMAVLLGLGLAAGLAAATARVAILDQMGWDRLLGRPPEGAGQLLCAIQDGRVLRPRLRRQAETLAAGMALARQRRPGESLQALAPLLDGREDYTSDDREVGVPQYWAALDLLAAGDRGRAAAMAATAAAVRPEDARVLALALRLAEPRQAPPAPQVSPAASPAGSRSWPPAGCDPVSARMALAGAAAADGDRAAALAILRPLAAAFPELLPGFGHAADRGAPPR